MQLHPAVQRVHMSLHPIIHLFYHGLCLPGETLFLFAVKLRCLYRDADLNLDLRGANTGKMVLPYVISAAHGDRDDGASGLLGDAEATFLERKHFALVIPRAFRENPHGGSMIDVLNGVIYGTKGSLRVLAVNKDAFDGMHPLHQQGDDAHLLLSDKAGRTADVLCGYDDVEITAVIADIKHWAVGWDILLAADVELHAADEQQQPENGPDQHEALFSLELWVELLQNQHPQKQGDAGEYQQHHGSQ